jgi:hypothetical protein
MEGTAAQRSIWTLLEGALFGVGIGMIMAVFGGALSPLWMLGLGCAVIVLGIFRAFKHVITKIVLAVLTPVLIFGTWHFLPKPEPPVTKKDLAESLNSLSANPGKDSRQDADTVLTKADLDSMLRQFRSAPPASANQRGFSLTDEANIRDMSGWILSNELHAAANGLKDEWNRYWGGEDRELEKEVTILQSDVTKNKRRLDQLRGERKQLRIVFNDEYMGRIRAVAIIALASQDKLWGSGSGAKTNDRPMRTIIAGMAAGAVKDDDDTQLGDVIAYLNDLADRVNGLPAA